MTRDERQSVVYEWGKRCFGNDQMTSAQQRGIRFMEEAIELAQSLFVDKDVLHKLIDYVYARPVGSVESEIGGVGVTLLALAECCKLSADYAEEKEIVRVLAKNPDYFKIRNAEKNAAGFKA